MASSTGPVIGGPPVPPDFVVNQLNALRGFGQGPTQVQLPQGFNPYAAPQDRAGQAPTGVFAPDYNPYPNAPLNALRDAPVIGGAIRFAQQAAQSAPLGDTGVVRSISDYAAARQQFGQDAPQTAAAREQLSQGSLGFVAGMGGQSLSDNPLGSRIVARSAEQVAAEAGPDAAKLAQEARAPGSVAGVQPLVDQQIAALKAGGSTDAQIAEFQKTMAPPTTPIPPSVGRGQITSATGATVSAGKMTRALQTALGTAEGGGMPAALHDFVPGGAKFAGAGRSHGGVIGAATRAVMANDPEVTAALGPELTQQLAQGKIAQLARASGADDTIIRQALQIMDGAAKQVPATAKSLVADAVATKTVLSSEAEAAVFAAEHKALTDAGLAATDEAMQAMRDRLIADARRAVQTSAQSAQDATGLLNSLRQQGKTDGQIVDALRGVGLSTDEAIAAVRNAGEQQPLFGRTPPPNTPPGAPVGPSLRPQEPIAFRAAKTFGTALGGFVDALKQGAASMDISQLGRQGLIPVVSAGLSRDPQLRLIARDAFVNAVKGYGDSYAGKVWSEVMADPMYAKWKAAGGAERVIPASSLEHLQTGAVRSELFTGPLANVTPIRASDRSFSLTLNALNFYRWKDGIEGIRAGGRIATEAEQKALSNWYNVTTGQGNLPTGVANALNRVFWAPRFVVSRVQTPYYAMKYLADPATREVGKMAAADLGKTVIAGLGFLGAAQLAGFKVGWDPTSTDFGKVQVGNTTIDIWGGFSQPAVFAARMVLDQYTSQSGVKSSLSQGGFAGTSVSDLIQRFGESKLGPGPGIVIAFASGKDFTGTAFGPRGGQTPEETVAALASGRAVPMSWADIVSAVQDDIKNGTSASHGLPPGLVGGIAGASSLLGVGASTYARSKAYDGLGRDLNGPLPDDPVLDAWKTVRENSAKNAKGSLTFSDLTAPDATIGSGVAQIALTPDEHGRLAQLVGDARKAIIGAAIASPSYQTGGQGDKEKILADAKTQADAYGATQFGVELAKSATDDTTLTRAAHIALSATGNDTGRTMDTLAQLAAQGSLTPGTKAAIDSERTYQDPLAPKYELSVDEYLRGSQLVQQYLAAPAYRIGDQQTALAASHELALLQSAYDVLSRQATATGVKMFTLAGYKTYLSQYESVKAGGFPISRFANIDGSIRDTAVSPQRQALSQDPLWSHFRAVATKRDPYAPH
jgi:hypothetical protein